MLVKFAVEVNINFDFIFAHQHGVNMDARQFYEIFCMLLLRPVHYIKNYKLIK